MTNNKNLSKYIAFLRHNFTNYDKYLSLMYDEEGNQTEFRKYVNRVLFEISTDVRDADTAFKSLRHIIKQRQKDINILNAPKPKPKPFKPDERKKGRVKDVEKNRVKFVNSVLKFQKAQEKREEEKRLREEEQVHQAYKNMVLSFIGLDNKTLKRKLLGGSYEGLEKNS